MSSEDKARQPTAIPEARYSSSPNECQACIDKGYNKVLARARSKDKNVLAAACPFCSFGKFVQRFTTLDTRTPKKIKRGHLDNITELTKKRKNKVHDKFILPSGAKQVPTFSKRSIDLLANSLERNQ